MRTAASEVPAPRSGGVHGEQNASASSGNDRGASVNARGDGVDGMNAVTAPAADVQAARGRLSFPEGRARAQSCERLRQLWHV